MTSAHPLAAAYEASGAKHRDRAGRDANRAGAGLLGVSRDLGLRATPLGRSCAALGPAADDFVVAGAQAMKFAVAEARATKDVDFVLNVLALRDQPLSLADTLAKLGYAPVPESRNFQFVKPIPHSKETMRIEFMAPEEFKRHNDIRVDIQRGVHARACAGGSIAVEQSDPRTISGNRPDGTTFAGQIRVTRPHALVMLKLLALVDRYNNIRGPKEARHDREEAQTHAFCRDPASRRGHSLVQYRLRFAISA